MTRIVRHEHSAPPPVTRLGLVVPGLGHLLTGDLVHGLGMMLLTGVFVAAAFGGLPRLGTAGFDAQTGALLPGVVVALLTWAALGVGLWYAAWRRVSPRRLADEVFNSNLEIFRRTLLRHTTGMLGAYGVTLLVCLVLLAPLLAPYDPNAVDTGPKAVDPSLAFLMGTDELGRDVWSRILYGGRISLSIGFVAVALSATIGTTIGATAAFFGGVVDRVLMFLVDVLLSLPRLVLLLTIVGLFRTQGAGGILLIVVVLGATSWMGIARIVRGEVLSLREREYVQAARALGYSSQRILFRHLVPNAMGPVIVHCSLAIGGTMLAEASLSFLGLGVPPPIATWGVMVEDGRSPLRSAPWISMFPGLAIMTAVLSFNLLGDGLRDALDPKLRGTQ